MNSYKNIIVVDDHELIFEGLKEILSRTGLGNNFKYFKNSTELYNSITSISDFGTAFIDIDIPADKDNDVVTGLDVANMLRNQKDWMHIIIITSHSDVLLLYDIIKKEYIDGVLIKSDISEIEICSALAAVHSGVKYYSKTAVMAVKTISKNHLFLDNYNRQILYLLSQGILTKNLGDHLPLSNSAIDKRKSFIKIYFGVEKGTDQDIITAARTSGYIK